MVCSCHKERLSCSSYCNCAGNQGCCNPYTHRETVEAVDEEIVDGDEGAPGEYEEERAEEFKINADVQCGLADVDYLVDEWVGDGRI